MTVTDTETDAVMNEDELRRILVVPIGRPTFDLELGAQQVGQIQSLLTTCVLHDVDPYTYLVDVLQRIDCHPHSQVQQLTPRLWKQHFADAPLGTPIEIEPPLRLSLAGSRPSLSRQ